MVKPYFINENRVHIEDLPSLDLLLHIFVQHNEPPRYIDLIREIQYHSRVNIVIISNDVKLTDLCIVEYN